MPAAPWSNPSGVRAVLDLWQESGGVRRCFAAERALPSSEAEYAPIPDAVCPEVKAALATRGITQLYSHQAQAVSAALAGRHVVVATPTASGKSLCFHIPVLHSLALDPSATALFVYPTKA